MRRVFSQMIIMAVFAICSSCSKTYYFHTAADNVMSTDTTQYVFENDTLKITYDFWDNCGRMKFVVYNKLSIPVFIDWKNSALIINDNKFLYWSDVERKTGTSTKTSSYGIAYGSESSLSVRDERVTSIPPHTKITKTASKLRQNIKPKIEGYSLTFRNYLAFSTNEDVKNDRYIDNGFHVTIAEKVKRLPKKNSKDFFTIL